MEALYSYFGQSILLMAVLYAIYWLFLRRDTFYHINRIYLILALLVSVLAPLFRFSVPGDTGSVYGQLLETVVIAPGSGLPDLPVGFDLLSLLVPIYLVGVSVLFIRLVYQVMQLAFLVKKFGVTEYKGLNLVLVDRPYEPFSMFNLVFLHYQVAGTPEFEKIIEHEKTHVKQGHTLDLVFLELLQVVQWFNPVIWFYRRSIKGIHEFMADDRVLSQGCSTYDYQQLLLSQTFRVQNIPLTHNFNHSLIKKRFIMMTKEKTKKINMLKLALVLPAAILFSAIISLSFSGTITGQPADPVLSGDEQLSGIILNQTPLPQEDPIFTVVEKLPEYPGGNEAMGKFLADNIKYPENARKNGIQGKVFVTYVVEKSGKVTNIRVLKGVNEELDQEAMRVIGEMPNWKPGTEKGKPVRVQFTLPIDYKLDGDKKDKEAKEQPKRTYQDVKPIDK